MASKSYTYEKAQAKLVTWLRVRRWTQAEFRRYLSDKGVEVSGPRLSQIMQGKVASGPTFISIFNVVTGASYAEGLVQSE